MNLTRLLASSLLVAALAAISTAQSRISFAALSAGNLDRQEGYYGFASDFSATGGFVTANGTKSFTGLDALGDERTMTIAGSASAQSDFGRLKTRASATLTNSYYNSGNVAYYDTDRDPQVDDAGSPDSFFIAGTTSFTDELVYGGSAAAGYRASYRFFVEGTATGDNVAAFLNARIGDNANESFSADLSTGTVAQYFTTGKYAIDGNRRQNATVSFTTRFQVDTFDLAEGTTLSGSADFSSTVTLDAIFLYDANDNLVGGYSVSGASGTTYPVAPVPEPATLAALGLGAAALLRRRRKS